MNSVGRKENGFTGRGAGHDEFDDQVRHLFTEAVESLHDSGTGDVIFAGPADQGAVAINSVIGAENSLLASLVVASGRGLGGRALAEGNPQVTRDYGPDPLITHHYDEAVLSEGIRSLVAVPTLVAGEVTGVVYCGHRSRYDTAAPHMSTFIKRVRQLSTDLARLRHDCQTETRQRKDAPELPAPGLRASDREALRHSYAELRSIRSGVIDDETRARLKGIEERLAGILNDNRTGGTGLASHAVRLSPRETDILSHVALGWPNARIAASLSLRESTVKSYLNTAMVKIGASTRHEAVSIARSIGVLP